MKLENQVCRLDQAKKLNELGVNADSIFVHWEFLDETVNIWQSVVMLSGQEPPDNVKYALASNTYFAYTVAELGLLLPPFFPSFVHDSGKAAHCRNERVDTFPLIDVGDEHEVTPAHILNKELIVLQGGRTEAESRTAMLIHLVENNYMTAEWCNLRLAQ